MNVNPTNFGGTNLVARLQATEQTAGPDVGLFGTETGLADFFVGTYVQGLVFTAAQSRWANRQRSSDQLADQSAVSRRRLGPPESGHRHLRREPVCLPGC